jgi:hypothetical protein
MVGTTRWFLGTSKMEVQLRFWNKINSENSKSKVKIETIKALEENNGKM